VKRIIQWVNALDRGRADRKMSTVEPVFVPAESTGVRSPSPPRTPWAASRVWRLRMWCGWG